MEADGGGKPAVQNGNVSAVRGRVASCPRTWEKPPQSRNAAGGARDSRWPLTGRTFPHLANLRTDDELLEENSLPLG